MTLGWKGLQRSSHQPPTWTMADFKRCGCLWALVPDRFHCEDF